MILQDVLKIYAGPAIESTLWPDCDLPFLTYCLENWMKHVGALETQQLCQTDLMSLFEWPSKAILHSVFLMYRKYSRSETLHHMFPPRGTTLLHAASRYNLWGLLKDMLQPARDVEINAKDESGRTAISYAAEYRHANIIHLLLTNCDIDPNAEDKAGWTPLHHAIQQKIDNTAVLSSLLERDDVEVNPVNSHGDTPLARACRLGNWTATEALLAHHSIRINDRNAIGETPLRAAIGHRHAKVTKLLLNHDAIDVSISIPLGQTLSSVKLYFPTFPEDKEIVQMLLAHVADVNQKNEHGMTPLMRSIQFGGYEFSMSLLERQDVDVNCQCSEGRTALTIMFEEGIRNWTWHASKEIAQKLLHRSAEVNHKTENGPTPLESAAISGHVDVVKLFLEHGADVETRNGIGQTPLSAVIATKDARLPETFCNEDGMQPTPLEVQKRLKEIIEALLKWGVDVNARDDDGNTPLALAAQLGLEDIVIILLDASANVNVKSDTGNTPFALALERNRYRLMDILSDWGADIDTENNCLLLLEASRRGYAGIVDRLLQQGVDPNTENGILERPLSLAATYGHTRIVELLIQRNVVVDSRDIHDRTPLMAAAASGCWQTTVEFLFQGADINAINESGRTPLTEAAESGHYDILELLLKFGADIDPTNTGAALCSAVINGYGNVVELLLRWDANVNITDKQGDSLLTCAVLVEDENMIKLLLQAGADPYSRDSDGKTPYELAENRGLDAICQMFEKWHSVSQIIEKEYQERVEKL